MTYEEMKQMSVKELALRFLELKGKLTEMKEAQAVVQKEFDTLRKSVLPEKMEEVEFDTVNISGVGRVSLRAEIYASIQGKHKEDAYRWLVLNGHGSLIKDTVNAGTLKAFIREQIENGEEIPSDLFMVTPYMMATLTKG